MPGRAAGGSLALLICPTFVVSEPAADAHGSMAQSGETHGAAMDDHAGHRDTAKTTCDYAVNGFAGVPVLDLQIPRALLTQVEAAALPSPITGIFPPHLPPATGPPSV